MSASVDAVHNMVVVNLVGPFSRPTFFSFNLALFASKFTIIPIGVKNPDLDRELGAVAYRAEVACLGATRVGVASDVALTWSHPCPPAVPMCLL